MKPIYAILICLLLVLLPFHTTFANSAEPPAIVLLVNTNTSMQFFYDGRDIPSVIRTSGWERYYLLYLSEFYSFDSFSNNFEGLIVEITEGDETFSYIFGEKDLQRHSNVYRLDIKNKTLQQGYAPGREAMLVALRVLLTLVIEGGVFFLFGFRQKRSWICFLITNLFTQGLLNIMLVSSLDFHSSAYGILLLIPLEIVILIIEAIVFGKVLKEYKALRRVGYALTANVLSLFLGGWMIFTLPI